MTVMAAQCRPMQGYDRKIITLTLRVQVQDLPSNMTVTLTDVLLQAGNTVTGWVPHVTEMPWTAGIVGN